MTDPTSGGMVTRADAQALMPAQTNDSFLGAVKASDARRHAGARATVGPDGKVRSTDGKHLGRVSKRGLAWKARTPGGTLIGLHGTKQEAAGALVLHSEGGQ